MRYVSSYCLQEGMILAKDLPSEYGACFLTEETKLTDRYIRRIKELGYEGIYIQNDLQKNAETISIINCDLQSKTLKALQDMFIYPDESNLEELKSLVNEILTEIINDNLIINIVDLKFYDEYTYSHAINVAIISILIGLGVGLNRNELYNLGLAGLLHDIGKIFIPQDIINKTSKLTDAEYTLVKEHTLLGSNYMNNFDISENVCLGILDHHERYDGSGYLNNKKGTSISLFGRIIAVADVYDAMTAKRSYKEAILASDVIEYIMANSGSLFDPEIVKIFLRRVAPFPVGTTVKLSNNQVGVVIKNHEDYCTRPIVKIIDDVDYVLDLRYNHLNVTISSIVDNMPAIEPMTA